MPHIPMDMLIEMLSCKDVPLEKRIQLAQEEITYHKDTIEKLQVALDILEKRKREK